MDKYKEVRKDALTKLSILCGYDVEDSTQGVDEAVAYCYRHGTYLKGAKASRLQAQWTWARCEELVHSSSTAMGK